MPQLLDFGPEYGPIVGATWNGRDLDRRFLSGLERPVWDSVLTWISLKLLGLTTVPTDDTLWGAL